MTTLAILLFSSFLSANDAQITPPDSTQQQLEVYSTNEKTLEVDKKAIVHGSTMFSYYISHGKMDSICYLYTQDAKLIPPGRTFVKGHNDICEFWKPDTSRTTVYHKTIPHEISIYGDTAYDYGTYEGRSKMLDGSEQDWQGKYLIIWKKENGIWKMYLDAWNR